MPRPSPELRDWWKPKLRVLDPWRELVRQEIEELYAERQTAPFTSLARELVVADQPAQLKFILCGARGSGKTTELVRLAREVDGEFCVIQTDLAAGLPETASTLAIVTLLGVAALHVSKQWSDPDADTSALVAVDSSGDGHQGGAALLDRALARFGDLVPSVADLLGGVGSVVTLFAPATGTALKASGVVAKSTVIGSSRLRDALARGPLDGRLAPEQRDDARAVVEAVNTILAELGALAGRPPLLLVDGLDKRTSVEDVELALSDEHLLRALDAPLVLTGPVNLRHDPRFRAVPGNFRLSLLYNVPVCERDNDEEGKVRTGAAGVAILAELYERRRASAKLPKDLIAPEPIERAARLSSGIVRDFLRLLHSACMNALDQGRQQVSAADLDAAIKAQRLELQGYLDQGGIDTLGRVLAKGTVPATPQADILLFENFIACYPNSNLWYRPHELIVDYVELHAGQS